MTAESCCKKESNFLENGEKNNQGERTDLIEIRDETQDGLTQRELLLKYEVTSSQLKVVDRYYRYLEPKRKSKPNIYWIHGSTGSGKTKYVYDNFNDIYEKGSTKWWDQYNQN
jgi:predicted alpha/beta-fold hydrolase